MAIRVSAYTVDVGESQRLEIAKGEDREFRLTFEIDDAAVDMTGATAIVMTVRNRTTGIAVFARSYSGFQGDSTAGTPRFQVLQADTEDQEDGAYDVDVSWTDASGYKTQLLVASTFLILQSVGEPDDSVTTPPAIPVVYGLSWQGEWTGKSGGYDLNDSVYAYDGSLGATAISTFRAASQGVTVYPVNQSLLTPASGWHYVGQHGGAGSNGATGATGPAGATGATGPAGAQGETGSFVLASSITGLSGVNLSLFYGDLAANHIRAYGGVPGATVGGPFTVYSSGSSATLLFGYDTVGKVRVTTTTTNQGTSGGAWFTVFYAKAFPNGSVAAVEPANYGAGNWENQNAVNSTRIIEATPTGFTFRCGAISGISINTYEWTYLVIGY